jgi:hypothetical protein
VAAVAAVTPQEASPINQTGRVANCQARYTGPNPTDMKTIATLTIERQAPRACFLQDLDLAAERLDLLAFHSLDEARHCDRAARVIDAARCRMEAAGFSFAAGCLRKQMVSATVAALLPALAQVPAANGAGEVIPWRPVPADARPGAFLSASGVLIELAARRPVTEAAALRYAATVLLQERRADSQALAA